MPPFPKSTLRLALLAGAFGLAASSASAQQGSGGEEAAYRAAPPESVEVIAPRFRAESTRLNGPQEKVSLSVAVPYGDLDLATRRGARELRWRVYHEAEDVCGHLAEAYPVYEANGTSCFKDALDNAMVRADEAITNARQYYWYGY